MTKHHPANERIKHDYFRYLREAKGRDVTTIDGVAKALARFEAATGHKDFKRGSYPFATCRGGRGIEGGWGDSHGFLGGRHSRFLEGWA